MEDKILISNIKGKIAHAQKYYTTTATNFLDPTQRAECTPHLSGESYVFWGGYENAERAMLFILPDDYTQPDYNNYMKVIRVSPNQSEGLGHRDYLGSVLGLGIRRDKFGDIIVHSDGCDIVAAEDISEYIAQNLSKVARINSKCSVLDITMLKEPELNLVTRNIIVSSLRLDCVIAGAYNLSRSECNELISSDKVQINWKICSDTSKAVKPGDMISLRGKGRFTFVSVEGCTKKGRSVITIEENITK